MADRVLTPEGFRAATNVSRETLERLEIYAALLQTWQPRINLVGPSTVPDLWRRHMLDSAQVATLVPKGAETHVDLGSGAGFPGLVLAIMGVAAHVHLIESDTRKCAFLREVAARTGTQISLHNQRIEKVPPFPADVVTARALAPLAKLLGWAAPFLSQESICLFHKGAKWEDELTDARKDWIMRSERQVSLTDPKAVILCLTELRRDPDA